MLYVWMGFLKDAGSPVPQDVQQLTTEFLKQPYIGIQNAGPLLDARGRRAGMMMVFDVESRTAAEALVQNSPYMKAGLYEDHRLYEFHDEIG